MTVIIAYSSPEFAFLAADSFRWDLIENRNVGPVQKVHLADPRNAFAMGGVFIDRSRLAAGLIEARRNGDAFADAARQLFPLLLADARSLMRSRTVEGKPFCISWYAESDPQRCRINRHRLPEDKIEPINGFDFMGPDTKWLATKAREIMRPLMHDGQIALDELALTLIGAAAARHPLGVGFPAKALILRRDGIAILRDLDPAQWCGPASEFAVKY